MSNTPNAVGKLTAYERWELPSFDQVSAPQVEEIKMEINLPTAADIEAIEQQAREEGYQAGLALGQQEGYAAGYASGEEKILNEINSLVEVNASIAQAVQALDHQLGQSLLDLALELAQQMVKQVLQVKPEVLLEIIEEAITQLPHFNASIHVIVHPEDASLLREKMGEQLEHSAWKILEDAKIQRGGARIETAHSQIDATLPTRWTRVTGNLGQVSTWLAGE